MPKEISTKPEITSLILKINDEIILSKQKIAFEKTITYWKIGKHINEHLLDYQDQTEYGDYVFKTLSEKLQIGKSTLYRTVQFYKTYPEIVGARRQLTWTHYRLLLTLKDPEKRSTYEQRVIDENLSIRELKELIAKEENKNKKLPNARLIEKRGRLYIHKLKQIANRNKTPLYIDLGFKIYLDKLVKTSKNFIEGSIVQATQTKDDYKLILMDEDLNSKLYTYKGIVKEIIDGDTLWVTLELGFNTWTTKKVRLKGINSAPVDTPLGKKAKKFITGQLDQCKFVIVKTYWRDKFNRYLADIFYTKNAANTNKVAETGIFLNQLLLDKRLVEKYNL